MRTLDRSVLIVALCLLGTGAHVVRAETLSIDQFKNSVNSSRLLIAEILQELAEAEAGISEFDHGSDDSAELRSLLPETLSVRTEYGTIEVSNVWIHKRLADFDATQEIAIQAVILNEIDDRLTAMSWDLEQIVAATERYRSKDEQKRKIAEILAREEFQKPTVAEESTLEKWIKKIGEWIQSLFPKQSPMSGVQGMGSAAAVLRVVLIIVVILLVGFGLYKLLPQFVPSLRRRIKHEQKERVVLGELVGVGETSETLFDQAEQMARTGDIRGAIRKGYIALICELGDRRLIGLARHRTNRDYLRELSGTQPIYPEVKEMTGIFERHWYGSTKGDSEVWSDFRDRYLNTLKSV